MEEKEFCIPVTITIKGCVHYKDETMGAALTNFRLQAQDAEDTRYVDSFLENMEGHSDGYELKIRKTAGKEGVEYGKWQEKARLSTVLPWRPRCKRCGSLAKI